MKAAAHTWISNPLEQREAVLVMHEVTVCVVEGTMSGGVGRPKRAVGKTAGAGLGNGPRPAHAASLAVGCR